MKKKADSRQLTLFSLEGGITARSARAELVDATKPQRKRRAKDTYAEWPRLGTRVGVVLHIDDTPEGAVEAVLTGQLVGMQYDVAVGSNIGRIRLDREQKGLSESLRASLPQTMPTTLGLLRKVSQ